MFKIFIDSCVWLDLAKDYQQQAILTALEELVRQRDVELILPRTVVDEFARNKARVVEESSRSLSGNFKRAKDAVENLEIHGKRTKFSASSTTWIIGFRHWVRRP